MNQTTLDAYRAADAAEKAWEAAMQRDPVCCRTPNARYLPCGRGEPGSELRRLHDAFANDRPAS